MKRQTKTARLQTDEKPEQIRQSAYEIFMSRGGAPGHDWDDWLLAEAEFKADCSTARFCR
jgi:hypothetical protein